MKSKYSINQDFEEKMKLGKKRSRVGQVYTKSGYLIATSKRCTKTNKFRIGGYPVLQSGTMHTKNNFGNAMSR